MELQKLIEKAETTHKLTKEELTLLLSSSEAEEQLAAAADRVRKKYVGDAVHLRGLIEFSSYCRRNCMYCGLRRDNEKAGRYRLSPDEITAICDIHDGDFEAVAWGCDLTHEYVTINADYRS